MVEEDTTTNTTDESTKNISSNNGMYSKSMDSSFYNVSIDGYDMVAEEITYNEAYNRREVSRHNIIGGTQRVVRTSYIPREYEFTTHVMIDPTAPDIYDNVFKDWMSKNVEVISKHMGGKFNAECVVKIDPNDSPNYLKLTITLTEIPDEKSLIPNDEFEIPEDIISKVKISSEKGKGTTSKTKDKKNKNDKTTKKNTKKKGKTNKKKKSNITKTK